MRIKPFTLLFLLFGLTLFAQSEPRKDAPKLTRLQREQLQVYQQISQLVKQGKTDQKKFFQVYYKFVADSNQKMEPLYRKEGLKLRERSDKALESQKLALSERLNQGAKVYLDMADVNKQICEAYEKGSVGEIKRQLDRYLELEEQMKTIGIKALPREWFTTKEAEQILRLLARKK
jgi:hypothetical protein